MNARTIVIGNVDGAKPAQLGQRVVQFLARPAKLSEEVATWDYNVCDHYFHQFPCTGRS